MKNLILSNKKNGFTLLEIIVSISLFALVIILVGSVYNLASSAYRKGANKSELAQNARVCLDRISREVRQAVDMITILPETGDDADFPAPSEIFFRDGHNPDEITYIEYYLSDGELHRAHLAYYFSVAPDDYVIYDSVDDYGDNPDELVLEDLVVGEYFTELKFWGDDGVVNIYAELEKNQDKIEMETAVFMRN